MLKETWVDQSPIYDVSHFAQLPQDQDVCIYSELDSLNLSDGKEKLPSVSTLKRMPVENQMAECTSDLNDIEDEAFNLDLAEIPDDLNFDFNMDFFDEVDKEGGCDDEENLVEVFSDVDLYNESNVIDCKEKRSVIRMYEDEYLYLGYKIERDYLDDETDISNSQILKILRSEMFETLGCPAWKKLLSKGLVDAKSSFFDVRAKSSIGMINEVGLYFDIVY